MNTKNNNAILSCTGVIAILLVTIVISTIMNGWVLSLLWIWFIVPIFGWPILSITQAIGLGMVVSFLTRHSVKGDETKDTWDAIATALSGAILHPILVIAVGYIVTLFL